jgi:hypothetical protein
LTISEDLDIMNNHLSGLFQSFNEGKSYGERLVVAKQKYRQRPRDPPDYTVLRSFVLEREDE